MHWIGYDATTLDIEVDPQRYGFGSRKFDFALHDLVSYGTYLPKGIYGAWPLFFVSARTNKRHHHQNATPLNRNPVCDLLFHTEVLTPAGILMFLTFLLSVIKTMAREGHPGVRRRTEVTKVNTLQLICRSVLRQQPQK